MFVIEFTMPESGNKYYVGKPDSPCLALSLEFKHATQFKSKINAEAHLQMLIDVDPNRDTNKLKLSDCMKVVELSK